MEFLINNLVIERWGTERGGREGGREGRSAATVRGAQSKPELISPRAGLWSFKPEVITPMASTWLGFGVLKEMEI